MTERASVAWARAFVLALLPFASFAASADELVQRIPLQEQGFPGPTLHTVMVKADISPGGAVPFHTHPGIEMAYVVLGEAMLMVKGQPDRHLSAGDSFSIPPGVIHSLKNAGSTPLVVVSTYVVDRDRPLVAARP